LEAFGALGDWRLALQLLARVRIRDEPHFKPHGPTLLTDENPRAGKKERRFQTRLTAHANRVYRITLGDVDEHVIDSFFNHICSGESPSMDTT